ncbi:hypothetical protein XI06_12975 [Bradyrhizobium sp. CCBAU 11434]|nr:hypothetical protein [Bradyrhizobium sp. CCBAU 11434]
MSDSFTSALLAALNSSVEIMLDAEPCSGDQNGQAANHRSANSQVSTVAPSLRADRENRYANTVSFGMAKMRSSRQGA